MSLAIDKTLIEAPELLIPRMKPTGPVEWAGCPMTTCVLFGPNELSGTSGIVNGRIVLGRDNPVPSQLTFSRAEDNGTGYHPNGIFFDGSGLAGTANMTYIEMSETALFTSFSYFVFGVVLNVITSLPADNLYFIYHDAYNKIRWVGSNSTSINLDIGNSDVFLNVPSRGLYKGRNTFVFMFDQRGSVRDFYHWANGKEFSSLGNTKDTSGTLNGKYSFAQDARENGGYVLESYFFHDNPDDPIPLETLRSLSIDPYQFLVPA